MKTVAVILCGGAGTRLWPLSRELQPKPFIRMEDGQSLLQKAFLHATENLDIFEVVLVTNNEYFDITASEINAVNKSNLPITYILESKGRNTAPAITNAAFHCLRTQGEDTLMLILPADHLISEQPSFVKAVNLAQDLARGNSLVTFGITPTVPETGYGYIEYEGNRVVRFIEKPSLENATAYLNAGNFLWNSGIFCFRAGAFVEHMRKHCQNILSDVENCMNNSPLLRDNKNNINKIELVASLFEQVEDNSIDYALLEKDTNILVIPCNMGWSDIGSWTSFANQFSADSQGNRTVGEVELVKTKNSTIYSQSRLVGAIGIEDTIIVETNDAILVANKNAVGDIRELYSKLKHQGHESLKEHLTVHRRWGSYTLIEADKGYAIKRMIVKPRGRQDLQMHHHRNEHWVVVSGMGRVTLDKEVYYIGVNQSTFIPAGSKHRLENPGQVPLIIIETQTGDFISESDIVRFED